MAVANAIAMTLGDAKLITFETLQGKQSLVTSTILVDGKTINIHRPLENFPNDVTYMNQKSLAVLHSSTKVWPNERVNAHLGRLGIEAKRCSASEELWDKWQALQKATPPITPSLRTVEVWAELEFLHKLLRPTANERQEAKMRHCDPQQIVNGKLGDTLLHDITTHIQVLLSEEKKSLDKDMKQ